MFSECSLLIILYINCQLLYYLLICFSVPFILSSKQLPYQYITAWRSGSQFYIFVVTHFIDNAEVLGYFLQMSVPIFDVLPRVSDLCLSNRCKALNIYLE